MNASDELSTPLALYVLRQGKAMRFGPSSSGSGASKASAAAAPTTVAAATQPASVLKPGPKQFYLTTAINYTNGDPHFGHAYEAVMSDVITRYHRACGRRVFFLTGTDEHGQKVQKSAEEKKKTPKEHCDYYAARFKDLDAKLNISYDRFVRTTDEDHKRTVKKIWNRVRKDIYLSNYEGWYNKYEENYVTPAEIEQLAKNDKGIPLDANGRELEKKNEESYFFRMSKYADRLKEHIQKNPNFIQPASARAEIVAFLENNVLEDLCVSRTSISWGVPVPTEQEGVDDPKHVMYVWFDALTNYVTGVNGLDPSDPLSSFWPASVHIVGKDIVRFHTVYWPTMLMAAGLALPECVFAHGFITGADGQKMSKSLGNGRDPIEQLNLYGVDALRYYVARATAFGWDLAYNEEHLCEANNDILLKGFGNLIQRVYKVAIDNSSNSEGVPVVPDCDPLGLPFDLHELKREFEATFSVIPQSGSSETEGAEKCGLRIRDAICYLEKCVSETNAFVDHSQPWKMKGPEHEQYRKKCARAFLEAVYVLAHFYRPFIPDLADRVMHEVLRAEYLPNLLDLSNEFRNLKPGHALRKPDQPLVLVDPLEPTKGKKARPLTGEELVKQKQEEKEKRLAQSAANKAAKETAKTATIPLDTIEVRVGEIVSAERAEGTKLFVEKVNIGNGQIVDVASGIADYYPDPSAVVGRRVLVVLNLEPFKPKQLPSFESKGMLLAAKSADGTKLELASPPKEAEIGERLLSAASGLFQKDLAGSLPRATGKQWDKAKQTLKVDAEGKIKSGEEFLIGAQCRANCFAETVRDGTVS